MSDDEDRAAYRRRRMNELLAEAEANVAETRAAKKAPEEPGPVVAVKRGKWLTNAFGVLILLAVAVLLLGTALTLSRFTGHDFADADRRGTATVEQCERHGPVTLKGFGYYEQCTVSVKWSDGRASRAVIDKPGFFRDAKPGDTLEIGQNSGSRGQIFYSRPGLPDRGWVTLVGVVIGILGVLPILAVFFYLRESIKGLFRRKS